MCYAEFQWRGNYFYIGDQEQTKTDIGSADIYSERPQCN